MTPEPARRDPSKFHSHRRHEDHHNDLTARVIEAQKLPRKVAIAFAIIAVAAASFVFSYALIGKEATQGCIRDQQQAITLRGILERALASNKALYEQHVRSRAEYIEFKTSTQISLDRLQVPRC
jgi:hypothetical protein